MTAYFETYCDAILLRSRCQIYHQFTSLRYRRKWGRKVASQPRLLVCGQTVRKGETMTGYAAEHERAMAFVKIALGQIKALRYAVTPHDYEI